MFGKILRSQGLLIVVVWVLTVIGVSAAASQASAHPSRARDARNATIPERIVYRSSRASPVARAHTLAFDYRNRSQRETEKDAHAAADLPSIVCGLLKKPVAAAVNDLVALLSHDRINGTLAGTLFAEVGFKPFRNEYLKKLVVVVKEALKQPTTPDRIGLEVGPFATNVRIVRSNSISYGIGWLTEVYWTPFDPFRRVVSHTVELSVNGGRYFVVSKFPYLLLRHDTVRFAVQLHDAGGQNSPWAYSPVYLMP